MEFLRQRVSIEIQHGNAAAVMGTVDSLNGTTYFCCLRIMFFVFRISFSIFSVHCVLVSVGFFQKIGMKSRAIPIINK